VICAALAAAGYGIVVGTLAGSYEQASMFGAVSVVIAAALGGIMVPVFAMPPVMQDISRFSPLGWGLNALTGIFVRGFGLQDVLFEISCLLGFAVCTLLIGWIGFMHRQKRF
jgi:ABC-2 type transport system permease protein